MPLVQDNCLILLVESNCIRMPFVQDNCLMLLVESNCKRLMMLPVAVVVMYIVPPESFVKNELSYTLIQWGSYIQSAF